MANPLIFLRPLRYDVHRVLLVQSGPIELALEVARRVRALFPGCQIEGLVRDADRGAVGDGHFDAVTTICWEDRLQVIRRLRRQRYDAVIALASTRSRPALRFLPCLLRTRAILLFNDHLDYFPVHISRATTLAQHLSGAAGTMGFVRWLASRVLVVPLATLFLLGSVVRIYARAAVRSARTRRRDHRHAGS